MKNTLLTILLCMLLVLVGCSPNSNDKVNSIQVENNIEKYVPQKEATKDSQNTNGLEKEIQEILDKNTKVTSFKYTYFDSSISKKSDFYYVKGDLIKVDNFVPESYIKEEIHTEVYIDRVSGTQKGYCRDKNQCKDLDFNAVVPPMRNFDVNTPLDWANQITNGRIINSEDVFGRNAIKINTNIKGKESQVWIDTYYGLVLKIENEERTLRFEDISANSVKDGDVNYENI